MCYHRCVVMLLLGLLLPFVVQAQTVPVNSSLTIQGQLSMDNLVIPSGTTPPDPCILNSFFRDTDATAGQQLLLCTQADPAVWTVQGDGGAGGAPTTAAYITTQTEAGLDNEVSLGGLTTGPLKVTVAAGVGTPGNAAASDIVALWTTCTGYLKSDGTCDVPGGAGNVAKVGTPVDNQVGVWTGDGTIEGDAALTFDTTTNTLALGAAGNATGHINLLGTTSGVVTIQTQDAAGTYNFNLPTTAGNSGDVLASAGGVGAPMTWETSNGTGNVVRTTSPSLTTPSLGVASATSINKVTLTAPATGSTLTIAEGKTLTASNTLTFTGTDASSVAFGTGGTVAYIGAANSWTDNVTQVFNPGADNAGLNVGSIAGDPATPDNGDLWYDSTAHELTARINGGNVALGSGGSGTVQSGLTGTVAYYPGDAASVNDSTALTLSATELLASAPRITTKNATGDLTTSDGPVVACTAGASDITLKLPAGASTTQRHWTIIKVDAGAGQCLVDGDASETINGATGTAAAATQWSRVDLDLSQTGGTPNWSAVFGKTTLAPGDMTFSAASRILGRGSAAGAGVGQELTVGNLLTISGTVLNFEAPAADDQLYVSDSATDGTWRTLTDCTGANKAVTYATASNTFGCNTISAGSGTRVPIRPYSAIPVTAGLVFGTIQDGDEMLGVQAPTDASFTTDAIWRLGFEMPPTLDTGCTYKLQVDFKANATANNLIINPKWAIWAAGSVRPSGGGLSAEGNTTITATGSAYQLIRTKITLDAVDISGAAGDRIAMDLTIVDSGSTLAVVSGLLPSIICE